MCDACVCAILPQPAESSDLQTHGQFVDYIYATSTPGHAAEGLMSSSHLARIFIEDFRLAGLSRSAGYAACLDEWNLRKTLARSDSGVAVLCQAWLQDFVCAHLMLLRLCATGALSEAYRLLLSTRTCAHTQPLMRSVL